MDREEVLVGLSAPEPVLRILAAAATLGLIDLLGDHPEAAQLAMLGDPTFVRTAMLAEILDLGGVETLAEVIAELCEKMDAAIRRFGS